MSDTDTDFDADVEDQDTPDGHGAGEGAEQQLSDLEQFAAEQGWAPKDKWQGDADKWVDAKAFIRRGPEFMKRTLQKQDADLADMKQTMERMARVAETAQKRAYEQAVSDLKAQRREAITNGDPDTVDAIDQRIESLDKPETAEKKPDAASPDGDPHFKAFQGENAWYGPDGDIEATAYAEQIAPVVGRKWKGAEFYQRIGEEVRKKFPDKFRNPARSRAAAVEGGGAAGYSRRGNGKGYADLPSDAKAACDRYVANGTFKTREDYVKEYFDA